VDDEHARPLALHGIVPGQVAFQDSTPCLYSIIFDCTAALAAPVPINMTTPKASIRMAASS
jgi:hypothetical protein